jgi:hypothetical protein
MTKDNDIVNLATLKEVMDHIEAQHPDKRSKPGAFWSKEGQCWFAYWENVLAYAQNSGDRLTLYRAVSDGRVVGCLIATKPPPAKKWVGWCKDVESHSWDDQLG